MSLSILSCELYFLYPLEGKNIVSNLDTLLFIFLKHIVIEKYFSNYKLNTSLIMWITYAIVVLAWDQLNKESLRS